MATATLALEQWRVDYHEAMAAAAKVRLAFYRRATFFRIAIGLRAIAQDFERLITLLAGLEACESSVLLSKEAIEIPTGLRNLFRSTCELLRSADDKGVSQHWMMRPLLEKIERLNQQLTVYADHFDTAQQLLKTRVSGDEADEFRDAIYAYRNSQLTSDQATDSDVREGILHF